MATSVNMRQAGTGSPCTAKKNSFSYWVDLFEKGCMEGGGATILRHALYVFGTTVWALTLSRQHSGKTGTTVSVAQFICSTEFVQGRIGRNAFPHKQ